MAQETGIVDIAKGATGSKRHPAGGSGVVRKGLKAYAVYGAEQQYLPGTCDWQGISVPNQPLVEAILREDIMR